MVKIFIDAHQKCNNSKCPQSPPYSSIAIGNSYTLHFLLIQILKNTQQADAANLTLDGLCPSQNQRP